MAARATFAARLLRWFDRHGRHDLPWQRPRTAYRVWVAEIMLQQTQVATVIPYYRRFLREFPGVAKLARSHPDAVLAQWSGLGYYARARNLQRAARQIVEQHAGRFPRDFEAVAALPGIGRSTAGAILAQAFGQRHAILDGNVRRVLARHAGIGGWPGTPVVAAQLWTAAESRLPQHRLADYTQAAMDLGATLCTARLPACTRCPVRGDCVAFASDRVGELPTPKPSRLRPRRKAHLLLVEDSHGGLLFERRPAAGIWGGLWCLPVIEGRWQDELARRYALQPGRARRLPKIRHAFSHYDLDLLPMRMVATPSASLADHPQLEWLTLPAALQRGLPAPIRTLLVNLK